MILRGSVWLFYINWIICKYLLCNKNINLCTTIVYVIQINCASSSLWKYIKKCCKFLFIHPLRLIYEEYSNFSYSKKYIIIINIKICNSIEPERIKIFVSVVIKLTFFQCEKRKNLKIHSHKRFQRFINALLGTVASGIFPLWKFALIKQYIWWQRIWDYFEMNTFRNRLAITFWKSRFLIMKNKMLEYTYIRTKLFYFLFLQY